jgi:hypothetical protein
MLFSRLAVGLLLSLATYAGAQSLDPHLGDDPAHDLYQHSPFLHGYIHGYEAGFHLGDVDVHMGHKAQSITRQKTYRDPRDYHSSFGDRGAFQRGYRQGLLVGYGDAFRDASFRAVTQIRRAAEGITADTWGYEEFDRAVSSGYEEGWKRGLRPPLTNVNFRELVESCLATRRLPTYCDAYRRGFGLGYADASIPQDGGGTQTARAGSR